MKQQQDQEKEAKILAALVDGYGCGFKAAITMS
jgi:hypothetical protein